MRIQFRSPGVSFLEADPRGARLRVSESKSRATVQVKGLGSMIAGPPGGTGRASIIGCSHSGNTVVPRPGVRGLLPGFAAHPDAHRPAGRFPHPSLEGERRPLLLRRRTASDGGRGRASRTTALYGSGTGTSIPAFRNSLPGPAVFICPPPPGRLRLGVLGTAPQPWGWRTFSLRPRRKASWRFAPSSSPW